ncbi:MAG: ribosomal protein L7/L12 [Nitritalea sp.]
MKTSEKERIEIALRTPITIQEKASKEEANQLKATLEAVGATVDLK